MITAAASLDHAANEEDCAIRCRIPPASGVCTTIFADQGIGMKERHSRQYQRPSSHGHARIRRGAGSDMAVLAGEAAESIYSDHVNPQWVRLLDLLEMNVRYQHCLGSELHTADGRRILDFLSGYCVHNIGHNHPTVLEALRDELSRNGPAMIQSHVAEHAGELAEKLCHRAGGRLSKVFFGSSGSEGIEAAIKFSRVNTGRSGLLYASGAFHGLTCGALSLMGNSFWREGFGRLLPDTEAIPFGDLDTLEQQLSGGRIAAFIVEPIQSEAGIHLPGPEYLRMAGRLCRRYGTLLCWTKFRRGCTVPVISWRPSATIAIPTW